MLLVELGYAFGFVHKMLNSRDWVTWAYVSLFFVVGIDICLYFVNLRHDRRRAATDGLCK